MVNPNQERIMLGAAILIPLAVVFLAITIYQRYGIAQQYNAIFQQANQLYNQALSNENADAKRELLRSSLGQLESAASLRELGNDAVQLRSQAQAMLDTLENVHRIQSVEIAVGEIPKSAELRSLLIIQDKLFALDKETNQVYLFEKKSNTWRRNTSFSCGPGPIASYNLGSLVDLVYFPANPNFDSMLMAMDTRGVALICDPDAENGAIIHPLFGSAAPFVDGNLDLVNFEDNLYVFDRTQGEIFIFPRQQNSFEENYSLYFTNNKPVLEGSTGLAIFNWDLYFLMPDSHILYCKTILSSNQCELNSLLHSDSLTNEAWKNAFQILVRPAPEPAIYIGNSDNNSIYFYSMSLSYQYQWQPADKIDGALTAFTVDSNRKLIFATGNRLFSEE